MNKTTKIILIISGIVIVLFLIILVTINYPKQKIGGERDKYGCLVSAGYSYNYSIGVCLKEWELDENQRQAVKITIAPLSYPVTIVEVEILKCFGCFNVTLQRNDNQNIFYMQLNNWTHIEDCKNYPYDNCPERCVVCPSCASCSSISCQTEESCESMGFNRSWSENIKISH